MKYLFLAKLKAIVILIVIIVYNILLIQNCCAINPSVVQWDYYMKSYDGSGGQRSDWLYDVKSTSDGGFLAVGYTVDVVGRQSLVIKLNALGDREWVQTVGNTAGDNSIFWDAIETSSGEFLCIGVGKPSGVDKVKLAQLAQDGTIISTNYYTLSTNTTSCAGFGIAEVIGTLTNSVKYVVTGWAEGTNIHTTLSSHDIFVLRLDASLTPISTVTFLGNPGGYVGTDNGKSVGIIYQTGIDPVIGPQGNATRIVVAGTVDKNTGPSDQTDIYVALVKFDGTLDNDKTINSAGIGSGFWTFDEDQCTYTNPRANNDWVGRVAQISDGTIVLAAELNHEFPGGPTYFDADGVLYKLHKSTLNTIWKESVSHYSAPDCQMDFVETIDNGFAVVASTADCSFSDGLPNLASNIQNEALLAKLDASGNVVWRRHFSGTYVNSTNYLCIFGIDLTKDGGFVICGDNEDDDDNACVIRLSSDCEVNYTGYTSGYTLSSNETWSSPKQIKGMMVVPYGKTLTINSGATIEFMYTREINDHFNLTTPCGITVEPGGKLILNNSTLRGLASCSKSFFWDGVTLEGDPTQNQFPLAALKQGQLIMTNNAVIRDAAVGVNVTSAYWAQANYTSLDNDGSYNYYSSTHRASNFTTGTTDGGGYISATDSKFSNCRVGVGFDKYPAIGYNYAEKSNFTDCIFECTGPILDPWAIDNNGRKLGNKTLVSMWDVHGARFTGNTFSNTGTFDGDIKGYGIYSIDADYFVGAECTATSECLECIEWGPGNDFLHLTEAIYALANTGSALKLTLTIDQSTFTDSYYGDMFISGITQPLLSITRNQFNLSNYESSVFKNFGLYLNSCNGYQVTENNFTTSYTNTNYGIIVNNGHNSNNELYKNNLTNLYAGIIAYKKNGNTSSGLSLKCNEFNYGASITSTYDIALVSSSYPFTGSAATPYGSLYTYQGGSTCAAVFDPDYHTKPAGNTFFNTCSSSSPSRLYADQWSSTVNYRFHKASTPYDPLTCYTSAIYATFPCITTYTADAAGRDPDACPSKLGGCENDFGLRENGTDQLIEKLTSINQIISDLESSNSGGDNEEIQGQISDLQGERDQIIYSIVRVYSDSGLVDECADLLIAEGKNILAIPFYIQSGDFESVQNILNHLSFDDPETSEIRQLEQINLDLLSSDKTWFDMTEDQEAIVREISNSTNSSGSNARNILKLAFDEDFQIDIPYLGGEVERSILASSLPLKSSVKVYPNPSNGSFILDFNGDGKLSEAILSIFNSWGQLIKEQVIVEGENNIVLDPHLSSGLLYCKVTNGNTFIGDAKVLVTSK